MDALGGMPASWWMAYVPPGTLNQTEPKPDVMTVIRENLRLRKEVEELKIQVTLLTELIERAIDRNNLYT